MTDQIKARIEAAEQELAAAKAELERQARTEARVKKGSTFGWHMLEEDVRENVGHTRYVIKRR